MSDQNLSTVESTFFNPVPGSPCFFTHSFKSRNSPCLESVQSEILVTHAVTNALFTEKCKIWQQTCNSNSKQAFVCPLWPLYWPDPDNWQSGLLRFVLVWHFIYFEVIRQLRWTTVIRQDMVNWCSRELDVLSRPRPHNCHTTLTFIWPSYNTARLEEYRNSQTYSTINKHVHKVLVCVFMTIANWTWQSCCICCLSITSSALLCCIYLS